MSNQEEYSQALQRFRELLNKNRDKFQDEISELETYLLENNSFENPLDRVVAEKIIEGQQQLSLDIYRGYPLWQEVSFEVAGEEYTDSIWSK